MERTARRFALLVLLAILAHGTSLPASATEPTTSACAADIPIETFDVEAKARRDAYRIGQIALVDVWVTDKFTGLPQDDVYAGVVLKGRRRGVFAVSKTDNEGRALVRLPLRPSWVEPGWVQAFVGAWESIDTPFYCTARYGSREYPRLFRIRP